MKIGIKLIIGFLILASLVGIMGYIGYFNLNTINSDFKVHHEEYMPAQNTLFHLFVDVDSIIRITEEYDSDWMTKEESTKEIEEKQAEIEAYFAKLRSISALTANEIEELQNSINRFYELSDELFRIHDKAREERVLTMEEFDAQAELVHNQLESTSSRINSLTSESAMVVRATVSSAITTTIVVILVAFLVSVSLGAYISFSISKPVKELTKASDELKKGNLEYEVKIKSNDEIGELAETFNQMRIRLGEREATAIKDRNDLLNSLLKGFEGKAGNIAMILMRGNIQRLVKKNPRIMKIIPKEMANRIKLQQDVEKKE